ncbi:alpha/beta fold hydrolase [Psychromarinibacter sp. S121]|uniref:alpha/beta fold hydrolase n=1 Tax=Psychromarinibacter sp. S121 TaxID=3415127 RepID=UPI003C7D6820
MRMSFADCELDLAQHSLLRGGAPVHVEPQVFDLIACLVAARGALVTYDDLIAQVWQGRIVSDATMAARISAARAAVGDDGRRQAVIRTLPRRGVQLAVPVAGGDSPKGATARRQSIRYTTSRDGTAIAWSETGEGPPLLRGGHWLSHLEYDWDSPVWQPVLDDLSRGRRLIRYDPRGTGLSDRVLNDADVEKLADDLEAVADAAGLDRFPLYAISQSVPVAIAFAARRPERVSRMVLVNGLVQGSTAAGDKARTDTIVGMIRSGWAVPGSAFMKAVATVFMPRATPEELASFEEMQGLSASADIAADIRTVIAEIDVRDRLEKVTCPVLVMHSSGDSVQDPEQSKLLARRLPDAEYQLLDSPNHVLVPSDPMWARCAKEVDRFLAAETVAG